MDGPKETGVILDAGGFIVVGDNGVALRQDARLIAAAPDLLAALEACEANLRLIHDALGKVPIGSPMPSHSTYEAWSLAHEAIRKARGQQPTDLSHDSESTVPEATGGY